MIGRHHEFIDGQACLHDPAYAGQSEAVLARAQRAGVSQVVCTSRHDRDWPTLLGWAARDAAVLPCVGWDPGQVGARPRDWLHRLHLVLQSGPAGLGLVGLDRWARSAPLAEQVAVLEAELAAAGQWHCPVVLRCRGAARRVLALLERQDPPTAGVLWLGFSGPTRLIEPLVRRGVYFGYAGDVLAHRHWIRQRILRAVPLDRLVVVSGAPGALPPRALGPYRGLDAERHPVNEPANLPYLVAAFAAFLGQDPEVLAEIVVHNALCLFGSLVRSEQIV